MSLKWKWPKHSKIFKNDQNTSKPENYQNTPQNPIVIFKNDIIFNSFSQASF